MKWVEELRRVLRKLGREEPVGEPPGGLSCEEAAARTYEWLDGELDPDMHGRVAAHLETCARCYPMLLFERSFREAVARAAGDEEAPDELRERIMESLEEEGYTAPGGSGGTLA